MKRILETAMLLMGTLGFWGFVYPEFSLTEENYRTEESCETEDIDMTAEVCTAGGQYRIIVKEDGMNVFSAGEKICIKSRALEYVYLIDKNMIGKREY